MNARILHSINIGSLFYKCRCNFPEMIGQSTKQLFSNTFMRKSSVALAALMLSQVIYSQTCDCKAAFEFTVQKIEANYSGFTDKVTTANRAKYHVFSDSIRAMAATASYQRQDSCYSLLNHW